jgi:hypothetical protein
MRKAYFPVVSERGDIAHLKLGWIDQCVHRFLPAQHHPPRYMFYIKRHVILSEAKDLSRQPNR